ncbi:MAG: class I SAM-dependent methyltransferase [Pirellula sp.]|nr:SAM-dependent methyltransferase [Pirellula sp.]
MRIDQESAFEQIRKSILDHALVHAVLSSPKTSESETRRVDVRPVLVQASTLFLFTYQTSTQHRHENLAAPEAAEKLTTLVKSDFCNLILHETNQQLEIKQSKKGKFFASWTRKQPSLEKSASHVSKPLASHNRSKNHLIPEGTPCPFLLETGVMNEAGKVLASHSKKFRQINRFTEFILDVVRDLKPSSKIRIIDFGCGKSYLTFATHYLLTHLLKLECDIVGLDLRADVIATCTSIVEKLHLKGIRFQIGDIEHFQSTDSVDMVVSLHACNIATDSALLKAIQWKSQAILAVPCCQHELNGQLEKGSVPVLASYGILKERMSALATDGMRAKLLEAVGYRTQMLEFIETEHTPKNLLIRAVLPTSNTTGSKSKQVEALQEVLSIRKAWGIQPLFLERRLSELKILDHDKR